jgi:hypothetical protein
MESIGNATDITEEALCRDNDYSGRKGYIGETIPPTWIGTPDPTWEVPECGEPPVKGAVRLAVPARPVSAEASADSPYTPYGLKVKVRLDKPYWYKTFNYGWEVKVNGYTAIIMNVRSHASTESIEEDGYSPGSRYIEILTANRAYDDSQITDSHLVDTVEIEKFTDLPVDNLIIH